MREAFWIFRKDVRHLWPRILLAELWIAALAWADVLRPRHMGMAMLSALATVLSFFTVTYLIVSLFHEEKTVGDERYWLTRPFPRGSMVAAKLLFIVVFVYLPTAIGNTLALTLNGYAPSFYWGSHAADALFAVFTWAIATAAMAAVTSGMVQFVWAAMLWAVGWFATMIAMPPLAMQDWPGLETIRADAMAALLLILGAVVVWLMFMRRSRTAGVSIVAASAVLLIVVRISVPWHTAFALKQRSGRTVDAKVAQMSFNPPAGALKGAPLVFYDTSIGVYLPVLLSGVPDGMQVIADRVALNIDGPHGSWRSGWERFGQLVSIGSSVSDQLHFSRTANGPHWLYFTVNADAFERLSRDNAHLEAQLAFTLFSRPEVVRMTNTDRGTFVPGTGFCAVLFNDRSLVPTCIAPFETPPPADLRWRNSADEAPEMRMGLAPPSNGFGEGGIWAGGGGVPYRTGSYPREVYLDIRRPIAWFERTLDIPAIRLADYH